MPPTTSEPRFFTQDWTITVPSSSKLKFHRVTPAKIDAYLSMVNDPSISGLVKVPKQDLSTSSTPSESKTQPLPETTTISPSPEARLLKRFKEAPIRHHALDVLVSLDGEMVGWGAVMQITEPGITPSLANVGIMLKPSAQGKKIGKVFMQVLLRLSCELEVDIIEAGTMKENVAMRALAKSVGLVETEEIKIGPDDMGVVAELLFKNIEREKYMGLNMEVQFKELEIGE